MVKTVADKISLRSTFGDSMKTAKELIQKVTDGQGAKDTVQEFLDAETNKESPADSLIDRALKDPDQRD